MYPVSDLYKALAEAGKTPFEKKVAYFQMAAENPCPEEQLPQVMQDLFALAELNDDISMRDFVLSNGELPPTLLVLKAIQHFPEDLSEQAKYLQAVCSAVLRGEDGEEVLMLLDAIGEGQLEPAMAYGFLSVAVEYIDAERFDEQIFAQINAILKKFDQLHMGPSLYLKLAAHGVEPKLLFIACAQWCEPIQLLEIFESDLKMSKAFKDPVIHYALILALVHHNNVATLHELLEPIRDQVLLNDLLMLSVKEIDLASLKLLIDHMVRHKIKLSVNVLLANPQLAAYLLPSGILLEKGFFSALAKNKPQAEQAAQALIIHASYGKDPKTNARLKALLSPTGRCRVPVTKEMVEMTKTLKKKRMYELLKLYAKQAKQVKQGKKK